jgi:hypothetical protein
VIKWRRMWRVGHMERSGQRSAYSAWVERPMGKRPHGRSKQRWEENIKMDL